MISDITRGLLINLFFLIALSNYLDLINFKGEKR